MNVLRRLLERYAALPAVVRWAVVAAAMAGLWWSSAQVPTPRTTGWRFDLLHNAAHPVAFGLLGASILLAIRRQEALGPTEALFAFAIATCYGVVDEVHQSVVPGRVCSIADACADMFGAALAIAGMYALLREKRHAVRLLPWLAIGALASVATATWSPC